MGRSENAIRPSEHSAVTIRVACPSTPRQTCVPQGESRPSWEHGRKAPLRSAWRAGPALSGLAFVPGDMVELIPNPINGCAPCYSPSLPCYIPLYTIDENAQLFQRSCIIYFHRACQMSSGLIGDNSIPEPPAPTITGPAIAPSSRAIRRSEHERHKRKVERDGRSAHTVPN